MMYAKIVNDVVEAFPYNFYQLREDYPNVSFPANVGVIPEATLNIYNVYSVTQQSDPVFDPATEKLVQGTPVFSGTDWVVTQVVTPLSQVELDQVALQEDAIALKADPQVLGLLTARPAVINSYIENNVTNLAEAKNVLKILARAIAVVAHSTLK